MKARTILASLGVLVASLALASAADLNLGTWTLNESKSTFTPGMTKNTKVVYAAAGDMIKCSVDGVDKDGKATHNDWTGKFDGKDYPLVGDPNADTRACTKVDDHTLTLVNKKGGKVVSTGKIVIAPDGRSRTLTASGTDASGREMKTTAVYDKQ
jgi:hypothetical protein